MAWKRTSMATLSWLTLAGCGSTGGTGHSEQAPRLVVLVTVDQLRPDLLSTYDRFYTAGLRRMLDEGLIFTNTTHDHAMTSTAPGHTTLVTGVFPSRHGIVGNEWMEEVDGSWETVYAVRDPDSPLVGAEGEGRSSRPILREGLPDWLLARSPRSRVVSISRKDRAAIGSAAKASGHVYWIAGDPPRFVTSAFYRDALPEWVEDFNRSRLPQYLKTEWADEAPYDAQALTRPDDYSGEGYWQNPTLPHTAEEAPYALWWIDGTPFPDAAVGALAEEALATLELGQRGVTDYLAVSFSQVDAVGHQWGPRSREQLNNLLHLDGVLGRFMDALEARVGRDAWVMAVSADHGVMDLPEWVREERRGLGRLADRQRSEARELVEALLAGKDPQTLPRPAWVAGLWTTAQLLSATSDTMATLVRRSYYPGRALEPLGQYGIHVVLAEGLIGDSDPTGTTHGSPFLYDRQVPLILLGGGIEGGLRRERASTVDVAPTLAALIGLGTPSDLDGRPLLPAR